MVSKKIIITVLIAAALFGGCQQPTTREIEPRPVSMRQVTDDLGRTITVPLTINRVVSTAPSVTENIFAVGAGDRLVGVTTFCDYPKTAKAIAKIGDTMTQNVETIVALKPQIVFVTTASPIEAFMKTLDQNGIAVYVTNPTSLGDILHELGRLAIIFGTEAGSEGYIDELRKRYAAVSERTLGSRLDPDHEIIDSKIRPVPVFVQISKEPLFTVGKASFLNDLIRAAGGKSVTANVDTAYPKLSKETALALQPDAIILSNSADNQEPNEVFMNSPAVRNGRVYSVNADILARPGPRLWDALEQIAQHLHPDIFGQTEK